MKRHLKLYVQNELFSSRTPPPTTNRRYYPKDVDIRNCMYRASVKNMLSKVDQENLEKKIQVWRERYTEDKFFFRPCAVSTSPINSSPDENDNSHENCTDANVTQNLLFVHQTSWQSRLITRYGNEITLLDATYKTMRYNLPLFFLVVKTNVNYIVVGSFIIQKETTECIEEALGMFKCWNHSWDPRYFMTDFCHEEINAIENTFTGNTIHIGVLYHT